MIPKTDRIDQLQDNLRCNNFDLSQEELSTLGSLDANIRVSAFRCYTSMLNVRERNFVLMLGVQMNNPVEIEPRLAIFA